LAVGGQKQVESLSYFYFVFFLIGLSGASIWPLLIHMLGNWYSKTNRGLIIGAWATCANIGNIIGIQLAAVLIKVFDNKWHHLIFINAIMTILMALLFFFFLIPHPNRIGIQIQENDGTTD
jgi:sugar phosphate permease